MSEGKKEIIVKEGKKESKVSSQALNEMKNNPKIKLTLDESASSENKEVWKKKELLVE